MVLLQYLLSNIVYVLKPLSNHTSNTKLCLTTITGYNISSITVNMLKPLALTNHRTSYRPCDLYGGGAEDHRVV